VIYLDTSAAAKALIDEDGSAAIRDLFASGVPFVSSRLLAVELHAVADRQRIDADAVQEVLDRVALVSLDDDDAQRAIALHAGLRTLDALHLATILLLEDLVTGLLAYDADLLAAARTHGVPIDPMVSV
jgi:predicted nucleic acid-binding protein